MDNEKEDSINLDELKDALINHVCSDNKAFFKHQQKNEEDIKIDEKKVIATEILNSSHTRFLSRFGMVLKNEHLKYFESQDYDEKQDQLIKEQIKQLKFNLDHQRVLIKNRRYACMIKLIEDKDYFSDYEMERRNPVLYNELVGKFISPAERAKRRRPNAQVNTLVDVLLDQIDYDQTCENARRQRELEGEDSKQSFGDEESDVESNQMQWGNFDDERVNCSSKSKSRKRNVDILVTAGERDILREEFLGIMYNDFLMGRDKDFFDYSQVDSNEMYDESLEKDQDFEDKYFDSDDTESHGNDNQENGEKCTETDESEDELDIYMKHIDDHIKRQNNGSFQEEFDDE